MHGSDVLLVTLAESRHPVSSGRGSRYGAGHNSDFSMSRRKASIAKFVYMLDKDIFLLFRELFVVNIDGFLYRDGRTCVAVPEGFVIEVVLFGNPSPIRMIMKITLLEGFGKGFFVDHFNRF